MRVILFILVIVAALIACRSCNNDAKDNFDYKTDRKVREYVKAKQQFVKDPIDAEWSCDGTHCSIALNYGAVMVGRVIECGGPSCVEVSQ